MKASEARAELALDAPCYTGTHWHHWHGGFFCSRTLRGSPTFRHGRPAPTIRLIVNMNDPEARPAPRHVSIGIIAWNEENALPPMLDSLFQQSLFDELAARNLVCEILCLANACTDRTVEIAQRIFAEQQQTHRRANALSCRVVEIRKRGKINAWNEFIHRHSARDAEFLFLMDADIVIHEPETLRRMLLLLETQPEASVAVDRPRKDIEFKPRKAFRDRLSLAASRLTQSSEAQLCAQLYCIRSEIARRIYLPGDFAACDDGFIKALVCTDFLGHPVWKWRIQEAPRASHTFAPYTTFRSILKNHKRQAIGQTIVHVLVDKYLVEVPPWRRHQLAETIQENERSHPEWLRRLVAEHLRETRFFWRLFPGLVGQRFKCLAGMPLRCKLLCLPAAIAGQALALISAFAARRHLQAGGTQYWPAAERQHFSPTNPEPSRISTPAG